MAEWVVEQFAANSNGTWTTATAEKIAEYLGGEVQWAYADLGIEELTIQGYQLYVHIDTTQTDVPYITWSYCPWGLLGISSGGYYNTGSFSLMTLATSSTFVANVGGGDHSFSGSWSVLEGDGFVAFKQTSKTTLSDNAVFVFDTATDLMTGNTVQAIIDSKVIDLENGVVDSNSIVSRQESTQSDGSLYVELINFMRKSSAPITSIYQAEHTYFPLWDYDSGRDKNVLVNGIKFNRMGATNLYIPLE